MNACVIFYNDARLLEECLKSLKDKVDKIICVDGAFEDFPHSKPYSTDNSIEIAKKYADVVVEVKEAWKTQVDKRNEYLKHVRDGEYWLYIDTDEELWSNIPNKGNYKVYIQPESNPVGYWWPRIFMKTPGFCHNKTHMTYADNNGLINTDSFENIGVTIYHKNISRPTQRIFDKETYRKIHDKREMEDRKDLTRRMHAS